MDKVLWFQSYVDGDCEYHDTIQGENFRTLMDLCFERADKFSLIRRDWPGAKDGPLEQVLRPYLLGEYLSYGRLSWFDHEAREKCYIYRANEETKAIFLSHITHLFGRDVERSDGSDWPPEKYKKCVEMSEAAYERVMERVETEEEVFGVISDEDFAAIEKEELREAREIWQEVFNEADFQSSMEDPCFFQDDELFFETITHEYECRVHVLDESFDQAIRKLGKWVDASDQFQRPLGLLSQEDGLIWYDAAENA